MLRYALQTLKARKGGFIGAFLALFCAAALVTACGILLETGLRGTIATERYAAAPVIVGADQNVHQTTIKKKKGKVKQKHKAKPLAERVWLPEKTLQTLAALPGVRKAVPETNFPAHAVGPQGRIVPGIDNKPSYGHAWSSAELTPFRLTEGKAPTHPGDVVLDRELATRTGLKTGSSLVIQSTGAPTTYKVSGIAAPQDGDLHQQTSLFFSDETARTLSGRPGRITAVGLLPKPGVSPSDLADQAKKALDGDGRRYAVATGGERGPIEFLDAGKARVKLVSMGGAMGGTSLLVAVLVVVGTFALSIQQRYRELALLRAIAATPKQVRQLIGREALIIGGLAGGLGSVAGLPIAYWLHSKFIDFKAIPDTLELTFSFVPFAAAVGAALLGAWVAARISARRTARIRPAEALSEASMEQRHFAWGRLGAGILVLALGIGVVVLLGFLRTEPASQPVTFLSVVVLAVAVSLLGPVIARIAVAVLGIPLKLSRVGGHLATANARANAKRMAAAVTPLVLLIGMACTVLFVQTTMGDAATAQAKAGNRADWVVASDGPGVPAQATDALRTVPGVTQVTEIVRTQVRVGLDKYPAQGISAPGLTTNWDPDVSRGSLKGFGDRSIAMSDVSADHLGKKPGDTLKVTLGDATVVELKVAAVYERGLGFGDLTMSHALVSRHVDNPLASSVLVKTIGDGKAGREQLAAALKQFPGLGVMDRTQVDDLQAEVQQSNAEVNYLAMGLIIAFTAIAVVNTLAMSVSDRTREFALLRLVGTTRRQVMSMLRIESALIVLVAAVLGTAISLAVLTAFSIGMTGAAQPSLDLPMFLGVLGLAALLTATATLVPGRVALGGRPADVISARQ
ncbi:FtsX-like permease family protein [Streptomyces sp. ML-6]|uniref:FtsX-like permease family protein n=1 Tax=Streptomyces sp. ML-6 TaxID=2982693 RepID=UPI0024BFA64A|nr:FtsX-like permease family protein [Streptomyces sp. ML-6]MDK0524944.1 ABC transporter permease [Streptomyces sp. ML-6]